MTANELDELLRENPSFIISLQNKCEMQEKEIQKLKDLLGIQASSTDLNIKAVNKIKEQAQEINNLKKQITQLSVSREPKIGDRVILIDDESEGVIESLSIAGGPRISFDDGCYGNYTKVELITLFAYKESE